MQFQSLKELQAKLSTLYHKFQYRSYNLSLTSRIKEDERCTVSIMVKIKRKRKGYNNILKYIKNNLNKKILKNCIYFKFKNYQYKMLYYNQLAPEDLIRNLYTQYMCTMYSLYGTMCTVVCQKFTN